MNEWGKKVLKKSFPHYTNSRRLGRPMRTPHWCRVRLWWHWMSQLHCVSVMRTPDRDLTPGMRETSGGQRGICRPMNGTAFWAEKSWKVSKFVWNNFKCLTCQNSAPNNYFSNTSQILTPAAFRPSQSEASIQVMWSLSTNRRPVFPGLLLNAAQTQRGIQFHTEYCSLGPGSNKFCNL